MLVRYAVLSLLQRQELHGYGLKSLFEELVGPSWSLNFGQIYQVLKELKRHGQIEGCCPFPHAIEHLGSTPEASMAQESTGCHPAWLAELRRQSASQLCAPNRTPLLAHANSPALTLA